MSSIGPRDLKPCVNRCLLLVDYRQSSFLEIRTSLAEIQVASCFSMRCFCRRFRACLEPSLEAWGYLLAQAIEQMQKAPTPTPIQHIEIH